MRCLGIVEGVRVVQTKLCPKRYWLSFFGVILTRTGNRLPDSTTVNHEKIHFAQTRELGYIPFYLIYCSEYLFFRIWQYRFHHAEAYRNISFEREAYAHQSDFSYLAKRRHFAQWRRSSIYFLSRNTHIHKKQQTS